MDESLARLRQQRTLCLAAARDLRQLLTAYDDLTSEVSTMRSQLGIPARNFVQFPTAALFSLLQAENETFGEFADGLGSQQASPSSVSHQLAGETLVDSPAEGMAPVPQPELADPYAQSVPQSIFDDIDVEKFFEQWPDPSLENYVFSYDYSSEPSTIANEGGFSMPCINHDGLHGPLQT